MTQQQSFRRRGNQIRLLGRDAGILTLVLIWLSAIFPVPVAGWAVPVAGLAAAALSLLTVWLARWADRPSLMCLVRNVLQVVCILLLVPGGIFAFLASAVGTPADGYNVLFLVLGGYFWARLLRARLGAAPQDRRRQIISAAAGLASISMLLGLCS